MPTEPVKDPQVFRIIETMMERYHGELLSVEATVGADWAFRAESDESKRPVLKLHGVPVAAKVDITPLKWRKRDQPDAIITIDREQWNAGTDEWKDWLIDHELEHLELVKDKDKSVVIDDAFRPKMKNRPHDYDCGWFISTARRHGANSGEVMQARAIRLENGQLFFDFDAGPATLPFGKDSAVSVSAAAK